MILSLTLGLSACGGTSSDNNNNNQNETPNNGASNGGSSSGAHIQMFGAVADGYLENAKVCLDMNINGKCDTNEPSTRTDANGQYQLTVNSQADADKYPVLVEVTTDTTDKDTGQAVSKPYSLMAPLGKC